MDRPPLPPQIADLVLALTNSVHAQAAVLADVVHAHVFTDELTDLFNAAAFAAWNHEDVAPWALTAIYVDLCGFKAINEKHSHMVGDGVLSVVGHSLKAIAAELGGHVCRKGGDEFVFLLSSPVHAETFPEALRTLVNGYTAPVQAPSAGDAFSIEVEIRATIGVATVDTPIAHADLVANAERAAKIAKWRDDRTVEFWEYSLAAEPMHDIRRRCVQCRAVLSLLIMTNDLQQGLSTCPNCAADLPG